MLEFINKLELFENFNFFLDPLCKFSGFADALGAPSGISPFLTGLTTTLASNAASPVTANALLNSTAAALRLPHVGVLNMSPVVLVSNLDENVSN